MTTSVRLEDVRATTPPLEAVLTPEECAAWLRISLTQLARKDLPVTYYLSKKRPRYIVRQVLEFLERSAI